MSKIECILGRLRLIDEIKKEAQRSSNFKSSEYKEAFIAFVEALEPHIEASDNEWEENDHLLNLLSELPDRLITQTNNGDKSMMVETKLAIVVGGALLLIGVAVGVLYAKKSAKLSSGGKTSKPKPVPPSEHHLLLIVPAKRLPNEFNKAGIISVDEAKKIIANAVEAYCYSENDSEGNQVKLGVEYSNTDTIDYGTDIMVYVHLKLFAEPSIIDKPISRLSLREKIARHPITVEQFGKLQSPDSTLDFYEI